MPVPITTLGKILVKLFPQLETAIKRCKETSKHQRVYKGIKLQKQSNIPAEIFSTLSVPEGSFLLSRDPNVIKLGILSSIISNGNRLIIELEISPDMFKFKIRGKNIKHELLGLDNKFIPNDNKLKQLINLATKITICRGVVKHMDLTPKNCFREMISLIGDENSGVEHFRWAKTCNEVVRWTATGTVCTRCQVQAKKICTTSHPTTVTADKHKEHPVQDLPQTTNAVCLDADTSEDMEDILKSVFPNAPLNMKTLLESQIAALSINDRRGIRWDKQVISTCLNLWVRSPKSYDDLKDSNMLILPSGRQLRRYKNSIKQEPGIKPEMLRWMKITADKANIPPAGRSGVLMHDEAKLQQDLVLERYGDTFRLIGFVDMGEEAFLADIIKTKQVTKELATDALQILFLGHTGFRFPIAHFATKCVKAHELYIILWNIISSLGEWGFTVDAILQDGGQQNREFMNMLFPDNDPIKHDCLVKNITNLDKFVIISQDFSHCLKKIRNSILSSGVDKGHTRKLQYGCNYIVWKQWVAAVKWDRETNSRLVHRKVTDAHLFPNQSEKMRNQLAEDMLNGDMLNLMKAYQLSLSNPHTLDATLQLIEHTSQLIAIFRDRRPITTLADARLETLNNISLWMQKWEEENLNDDNIPMNKKMISLPSAQCRQDLHILIKSFYQLCCQRSREYPGWGIVPSRFNTDLVENHFCQERGLHNGNATHPNLAVYSNTVNSIIIGQSSQSRGRKSNAGIQKALPYSFCAPGPIAKKQKLTKPQPRL